MLKCSALPTSELPAWHLTKSPTLNPPELLLNQQNRKDQQGQESTNTRMSGYYEPPLKKQKIKGSIRVLVPKSHDPVKLQWKRDLWSDARAIWNFSGKNTL